MSYMSTLATAGITVKEMADFLQDHPGIDFDEAVKGIENRRHTDTRRDGRKGAYHEISS